MTQLLSARLWAESTDLARACLVHPFVRGIADGTLTRGRFAGYVAQDAYFLETFARAYCLAAAKAPDTAAFRSLHELAGGVLAELSLHDSYARLWGVDLAAVAPLAATRRYTDFLLATAWANDVGVTCAAMTPCMRLYAHLAGEMVLAGAMEHAYTEWIATYGGAEFRELVVRLEGLVDAYAADTPQTSAAYRYAMQCELAFFDSAWEENR